MFRFISYQNNWFSLISHLHAWVSSESYHLSIVQQNILDNTWFVRSFVFSYWIVIFNYTNYNILFHNHYVVSHISQFGGLSKKYFREFNAALTFFYLIAISLIIVIYCSNLSRRINEDIWTILQLLLTNTLIIGNIILITDVHPDYINLFGVLNSKLELVSWEFIIINRTSFLFYLFYKYKLKSREIQRNFSCSDFRITNTQIGGRWDEWLAIAVPTCSL